ncbi:MAG: hypothetical protein K1X65_06015 [Caldilineales bacterium]|nr:hypothetical protein [Caldilineales bacterium]
MQWNPSAPFWLDVAEFERLSAAPATLAAAVPLYTGDLLPELYDDWIFFERERLQERFFTILAQLAARSEAQGDYQAAIGYAGHILRRDPLREETSRWLMALHYRAGDRNAALQEYRRLERCLQTELDLPPLPETKALYEAIASGETLTGPWADESERAWSPPHNLPAQVAAFVGREEELTALETLLDPAHGRPPCRLLTLTGAGGSGKTTTRWTSAGGFACVWPGWQAWPPKPAGRSWPRGCWLPSACI